MTNAPRGRKTAHLEPAVLDLAMTAIFKTGEGVSWRPKLAEMIDVDVSTVHRWAQGRIPIPKWVAMLTWSLLIARGDVVYIPVDFNQTIRDAVGSL